MCDRTVPTSGLCCDVVYATSGTVRPTIMHFGYRTWRNDLALTLRLLEDGHMSPFAHIATSDSSREFPRPSNFAKPWEQFRKHIPGERVHGSVQMSGDQRLELACRCLGLCFGDRDRTELEAP